MRRAGQVWEIDANGIPDTENPISIGDDEVSSGGTGKIPGAVDFFHSAMFNNDGTVAEHGGRVLRERLPDDDDVQPAALEPGRRNAQDRQDVLLRHGTGNSSASSTSETCGPRPRRASTAPRTWACSHGHQARPARQRLVHGRGRRDRLHQPESLKEIAYYDPDRELGHLVRVPVHGPDVQEGARDPRLRVGRRHQQRPRAGHGGVPDDRREARQAEAWSTT